MSDPVRSRTIHPVEPDDLPDVYLVALELRAAGLDHAEIAERIDVDEAAIENLLHLADAKASRVAPDTEWRRPRAERKGRR